MELNNIVHHQLTAYVQAATYNHGHLIITVMSFGAKTVKLLRFFRKAFSIHGNAED